MPGRDGTGPLGNGPLTGGGFGYCQQESNGNIGYRGFQYPNTSGIGFFGRGRGGAGRGIGFGRGYRNRCFYPNQGIVNNNIAQPVNEKQYLESTLKDLENEINSIKERLEVISKEE